jgi:hypothetical protein
MFVFSLRATPVPLPLGWMLSKRAAEAIAQQMHDLPVPAKTEIPTRNQETLNLVVAALHRTTEP